MSVKQSDIVVDYGTNELSLMEFTMAGQRFGINVSKVREIMQYQPLKPMQNAHPAIEGIFKPRDEVLTVIDLAGYLKLGASEDPERDIFIITRFNSQVVGFHVHSVVGMARVSWENIHRPDDIIYGGETGQATGVVEYDGRLITILDFEALIAEISPASTIQVADVDQLGSRIRSDKPVLVVEDSMILSRLIMESLQRAGYIRTVKLENGQQAWDFLRKAKLAPDHLDDHVACIISDIEMPLMDGHRLTRLVKEDPVLQRLPVVLFSSLINEELRKRGEELGADAQISKPEIARLVTIVDRLIGLDQTS